YSSSAQNWERGGSRDSGILQNFFNHATVNYASDADLTALMETYSANIIKITDTGTVLTTGRNFILPNDIGKSWTILNSTAQTITVKLSATSGIAIATTKTATVYSDRITIFRETADI
ncbi:MAG: hypothetical protein IIB77_09075, partial [Proteobacteria bacterium]|nr:hypothetical protein [Pseudomonadota bacterium]